MQNVANKASKTITGVRTRHITNLLKEKGRLTRNELFELSSRDIIPTKSKLRNILDYLIAKRRVKPFLPVGKIFGKDPYSYKLNPTKNSVNFPDIYGNERQKKLMKKLLEKDETGLLKRVLDETPIDRMK